MWVFNFGQNRRIFHARVLLDGGAIQDIDRHYPQNPRTARLKTCSGRLIRRVSCLCTKSGRGIEVASASIGCCGVDPARYARRCRAWASLRAAARSQLRHEGLIAPQAITALSSASAQFRKRRDRKRAHQVLARRGERRVGPSRSSALKCSVCRARSAGSTKYIGGYPWTCSRRCSSPNS